MSFPKRPKVRDALIFRQVEDEFVIYDPVTDRTAMLNVSAALVLDLCDAAHTLDEIASEVAAAFSTDVEAVHEDVEASVKEFVLQGFIETGE